MNIKDDDRVSAVALAAESDDDIAPVDPDDQIELDENPPSVDGDGAGPSEDGSAE
jgi:hypothetical protein